MKSKRRWLLLIFPIALFVWAWQAASWRPKLVGVQPGVNSKLMNTYSQLVISPNGEYMVSYASGRERSLAMRAVASQKILWQHSKASMEWIKPLAFSPDNQFLAVISDRRAWENSQAGVDLVNASTGKARRRMISTGYIESQSVAFLSPRELVVASHQGVSIVETQTGKILRQWSFDLLAPTRPRFPTLNQSHVSADGKTIIVLAKGKSDTSIGLYDAPSGQRRRAWTVKGVFRKPRLSPDGTLCALQQEDRDAAEVYDCANGKQLWGPFVSRSINPSWNWSKDSQQILSFHDSSLNIFDARTGRTLRESFIPGNTQALALDPRGDYFYTLDGAGKIWRWRLR